MPRSFCSAFALAVVLLAGCRPTPFDVPHETVPAVVEPGTAFDPSRAGTIAGRVTWAGDVPDVPPLEAVLSAGAVPNPFAPRIDPATRGLAGAVVFLTRIDPAVGRTWDLPPVSVEMSPAGIQVIQGDGPPKGVGFVKRGSELTMRSTAAGPFMLRARGAEYLTLAFPEPDRPLTRRLDKPGAVEFTSGSGQFWAAADVIVCDHPYYAATGSDGSFTLSSVPAGEYELGVRVRDWHIVGKDRDPETGLVSRLRFAPPVELRKAIRVEVGQPAAVDITIRASEFPSR